MSGVTNIFDSPDTPAPKTPKSTKSARNQGDPIPSGASGSFGTEGNGEKETSANGPFPVEHLPPTLREIVEETSRVTQTPSALAALVALGILSASYGGGLLVNSGGGRVTPPNLFLLGIARSGTGKGRVFSIVAKPFLDAERESLDLFMKNEYPRIQTELSVAIKRSEKIGKAAAQENDDGNRKKLTSDLQKITAEIQRLEHEKNSMPCYSVGDVTREVLAILLSHQPGEALASLSAEARGIIGVLQGKYNKGKSSDEDIYLSSYSGDFLKVNRVSREPVILHAPRLSLVWLIQPDIARKLAEDDSMTESGLLPRILLCDIKAEVEDEPENFPEMDGSIEARWKMLIKSLLFGYRASGSFQRIVVPTDEAREIIRDFKNSLNASVRVGGELRDVDSYVMRWAENAWRLALCLHGAIHGMQADMIPLVEDTAQRAVEIIRWFSRAQLEFLSASRSDRAKARLERVLDILRAAGGSVTLRNLRKSHGFEEDELRKLTERFPARLEIRTNKTGGRDSIEVFIPTTKSN